VEEGDGLSDGACDALPATGVGNGRADEIVFVGEDGRRVLDLCLKCKQACFVDLVVPGEAFVECGDEGEDVFECFGVGGSGLVCGLYARTFGQRHSLSAALLCERSEC